MPPVLQWLPGSCCVCVVLSNMSVAFMRQRPSKLFGGLPEAPKGDCESVQLNQVLCGIKIILEGYILSIQMTRNKTFTISIKISGGKILLVKWDFSPTCLD